MTIPTLVRTWQFQVNQLMASQGTQALNCKLIMWTIKEALKGSGAWTDSTGAAVASAGNWTVRSSCDGSGGAGSFGNNDNVDRWVTSANLIWANPASNHSWIVLEQTGVPGAVGNLQVCIDLRYTGLEYEADIVTSVSANFGSGAAGTATARPTATDEQALNAAGISTLRWGGPSGDARTMLHVLKTNDGKATRIIGTRPSNSGAGVFTVLYWAFELPTATAAWTAPSACIAQAIDTVTPSASVDIVTNFSLTQLTWGRIPGGANFASSWSGEGTVLRGFYTDEYGSSAAQIELRDVDNEAPMVQIGLYSSTVNSRGRNGQLVDLYQGLQCSSTMYFNEGRTYPGSGTLRQWIQFGDYIHPWNRSIPIIAA